MALSILTVGALRIARRGFDTGARVVAAVAAIVVALVATSRSAQIDVAARDDRGTGVVVPRGDRRAARLVLRTAENAVVAIDVRNTGRLPWDSRPSRQSFFGTTGVRPMATVL